MAENGGNERKFRSLPEVLATTSLTRDRWRYLQELGLVQSYELFAEGESQLLVSTADALRIQRAAELYDLGYKPGEVVRILIHPSAQSSHPLHRILATVHDIAGSVLNRNAPSPMHPEELLQAPIFTDEQQQVINHRYLGEMTFEEIGERIGHSRSHAQQIEQAASASLGRLIFRALKMRGDSK